MRNGILDIRGLEKKYYKTNKSQRTELFYNMELNNLLILDCLDKSVDVEQIINGIRNNAYLYLIDKLNTKKNIIVYWSAVEGTTSDYNIYYESCIDDLNKKSTKDVIKFISGLADNFTHMKYNEIYNGVMTAIEDI